MIYGKLALGVILIGLAVYWDHVRAVRVRTAAEAACVIRLSQAAEIGEAALRAAKSASEKAAAEKAAELTRRLEEIQGKADAMRNRLAQGAACRLSDDDIDGLRSIR